MLIRGAMINAVTLTVEFPFFFCICALIIASLAVKDKPTITLAVCAVRCNQISTGQFVLNVRSYMCCSTCPGFGTGINYLRVQPVS